MAGIDLGTHQSAIAVVENGLPRLLKLSPTELFLPSVVFIDARGATYLGTRAQEAMLNCEESEGTGYTAWKKRMGQDDRFHFPAARRSLTAPDLSALIIGELLRVYRREMREDLASCVVTVPAKFDHSAYDATNKACELAHLKHHPLLQEPIAAALAYGFSSGDQRANWMVFDLGDGTLDISLMTVREGRLVVLKEGQAGDPQLGGSQFVRELLDFVLGSTDASRQDRYNRLQPGYAPLRKQYRLAGFSEKTHRTAWYRLMLVCEAAKIELSRKEEATVELGDPLCRDEAGREVRVEVRVTRSAYDQLIAPDIDRAVTICETLLRHNRMTGKDICQFILLGKETQDRYLQTVLQHRLGVAISADVDPSAAVALGAALHAETIEIPSPFRSRALPASGAVSIKLEYEPTSRQPSASVAGVIDCPAEHAGGLRVEIRRQEHPWSSGQLPVDETGFFTVELPLVELGRPYRSRFTTQVFDANGRVLTSSDEPKIWHPFPKVDAVLANTLGIAMPGNRVAVLVPQGERLPARKTATMALARPVRKGARGNVIDIPVVQAVTSLLGAEDTDHADCCLHMGSLIVKATDERITMDLPRGTDIDITFEVNESQQTKVRVYVPLLDEEFEAQVTSEPYGISLEDLETRFAREEERLKRVREIQRMKPHPTVSQALEIIDREQTVVNIQQQLVRARGGQSSAMSKGLKSILELAATINAIWPLQEHPFGEGRASASGKAPSSVMATSEQCLESPQESFYTMVVYVEALEGWPEDDDVRRRLRCQAAELIERLIRQGAPEQFGAQDAAEMEAVIVDLREAYPDLDDHVRQPHVCGYFRDLAKRRVQALRQAGTLPVPPRGN